MLEVHFALMPFGPGRNVLITTRYRNIVPSTKGESTVLGFLLLVVQSNHPLPLLSVLGVSTLLQ